MNYFRSEKKFLVKNKFLHNISTSIVISLHFFFRTLLRRKCWFCKHIPSTSKDLQQIFSLISCNSIISPNDYTCYKNKCAKFIHYNSMKIVFLYWWKKKRESVLGVALINERCDICSTFTRRIVWALTKSTKRINVRVKFFYAKWREDISMRSQ